MSRNNPNTEEDQEGAINLTPMLDVVFIMLIFFIVTATFIKETGIEVDRPDATTARERSAPILVAVSENNEIHIDRQRVDSEEVRIHIERLLTENPRGTVVVQSDRRSNVKLLVEIANAARDAGVEEVSVSTERN